MAYKDGDQVKLIKDVCKDPLCNCGLKTGAIAILHEDKSNSYFGLSGWKVVFDGSELQLPDLSYVEPYISTSSNVTLPWTTFIPSGIWNDNTTIKVPYSISWEDEITKTKPPTCECGQAKVSSSWGDDPKSHSTWCDVYKKGVK